MVAETFMFCCSETGKLPTGSVQMAMENERLWLRQNRTAEGDDSVEPKDIFPD